jgi:hypothetical protein
MAPRLISRWRPARRWRRRGAVLLLALLVLAVHRWVGQEVMEDRAGFGASTKPPVRMEVAFVRELAPTAPPRVAPRPPAPPPPPPRRRVAPVQKAASQPEPVQAAASAAEAAEAAEAAASAPEAAASAVAQAASAPESIASQAEPALAAASAPSAAPAASAPSSAYDWLPPSTQLSYSLTGDYRGPVEGSAQVRWIRVGARYQVQIDTRVALVVTRRMTSDGELGAQGLVPRRYDEETETLVTAPRRNSVRFEEDHIVLGNGSSVPRPPGAQDAASQLVQLVWAFSMQPQKLVAGGAGGQVAVPIALPRRVDDWVYDIQAPEVVHTRFGAIEAFPVKPRRPARPGHVLTVQGWFAPTLQYLPIKLRIEQHEGAWVELLLERPPLQAAPSPSATP